MKRVSIVNLGGRAYHVEDEGSAVIEQWLDTARQRLATDPDRDELLLDFERAIGEHCEAVAPNQRDVVTTAAAREIVASLGEVEPATVVDGDAATTTEFPSAPASGEPDGSGSGASWRTRKLYRMDEHGEHMVAGVCGGVAAYLNLDVTIVRLAAVLLTVVTGGGFIIGYIVLAFVLPKADTPAKRAAAQGSGATAQEMIASARVNAGPALQSAGSLLKRLLRGLAAVVHGVLIAAIWIVTAAWLVQLVLLAINGGGLDTAFDAGTNDWWIAAWVTCIAWTVIAVLLLLNVVVALLAAGSNRRSPRGRDMALGWVASFATVAAVLGIFAIPASYSKQLSELRHGHARVELYDRTVCFVEDQPSGSDERDLRSGGCDEVAEID